MNSLTTHYRRSQLIALPVPGGKAKVEYCYAVNVPGDREIVTHSFAEWAVGDFNRQKELQAAAFSQLSDSDPSKSDASKSDPSKFDASKSGKKAGFHPSESGGDPSVKSKHDPSDKKTSRPDASQPDTQTAEQDFLTRHPDAVVFSPKKRQWGTQDDLTCAQWLWKKIIALYEHAAECDGEVVRPKEPNWTAWANEIRLMCVQDGRTHKQICEMYSRVSRDPFWCRNVLSPSKLREKWDELSLRLSPSVSTYTEKREDPYFKASYDNVDYSQIPAGFRG